MPTVHHCDYCETISVEITHRWKFPFSLFLKQRVEEKQITDKCDALATVCIKEHDIGIDGDNQYTDTYYCKEHWEVMIKDSRKVMVKELKKVN